MDSLTQLTFGAAIGHAVLGHKVGKKALIWGAVLGTLPDLDVFIPMGGPVDSLVYHRGFSHSIFVLALISPLLAWLITKIHPKTRHLYRSWLLASFLILEGSVFLDLLTVYGTQIFWPLDKTPLSLPVFFIIDPLFTIPIFLGSLCALFANWNPKFGVFANRTGLVLSLLYLTISLMIGVWINRLASEKLKREGINTSHILASPAPFTNLLWRVIGTDHDQYFETYLSVFDGDAPLHVDFYPRNLKFLEGIQEHPPVQKLQHFTRGYYRLKKSDGTIVMTDLRMGSEPQYVFEFALAQKKGSVSTPIQEQQLNTKQDLSRLKWIWERIWTPLPQMTEN